MSGGSSEWQGRRVERLRGSLREAGLAGLVVFGGRNIRYLTGFTGSDGIVVVREDEVVLVSDFRYRLQAAQEAPDVRFVEVDDGMGRALLSLLKGAGRIGFESDHLTIGRWQSFDRTLEDVDRGLVAGLVEKLRMVKTPEELPPLRAAARLAALTEERLQDMHVVGRSERDVALDLEMWVRQQGSEPTPFSFIVAAGPRGAMPHAEVTTAVIEPGHLLVVDLGAVVDGYASDTTRTFATGSLGPREHEIYDLVLRAQRAARDACRPGMTGAELDAVARGLIEEQGMGEYFKHSLGHGVGLDVHEEPRISSRSSQVLEPGMVITIEPGIYLPDLGGVRIEDTVLVTEGGAEVLTESERGLLTLA